MSKSVGILGLSVHLPENVRTNDWWPDDVVEKWRSKRAAPLAPGKTFIEPTTPGERAVAAAMMELRDDPFHGARERRILPDGVPASVMELEAARAAISKAGIDPAEIGLLLCNTLAPDFLVTNNACLLHHNLGLSPRCYTMSTEVGCNAFIMQMALAQSMITGGRTRYALLVQSSNVSRLLPKEEAHSPWFADGCAAQIVGLVPEGYGILGESHRTAGEFHRSMVGSTRGGGCWYDEGRVEMFSLDHEQARRMFFDLPSSAATVATEALANAGQTAADVDFFAPHQATGWMRRVLQDHLRLSKARFADTFPWAGSIAGANVPLGLSVGEKEGTLRKGDLVLMFSGGAGTTYSSLVMRWGN